MQKAVSMVFDGVRQLGLPSVLCLACVGYLIWQSVTDKHLAADRLQAERDRTAEISEVVNQNTASRVEMTEAVRSLTTSNVAIAGSVKALEIEVMRHLPNDRQ